MTQQGTHIDGKNAAINNILLIPDADIGVLNLHLNNAGNPVLLNLTDEQIKQINEAQN